MYRPRLSIWPRRHSGAHFSPWVILAGALREYAAAVSEIATRQQQLQQDADAMNRHCCSRNSYCLTAAGLLEVSSDSVKSMCGITLGDGISFPSR